MIACARFDQLDDFPDHLLLVVLPVFAFWVGNSLDVVGSIEVVLAKIGIEPDFYPSLAIDADHILVGFEVPNKRVKFLKAGKDREQDIDILG